MRIRIDRRSDQSCALFIDGDLQFDSRDERIYHECLALPALALVEKRCLKPLSVLIVGGGDGLTAREVLKSSSVVGIDLVDYSQEVVSLGKESFAQLNEGSLHAKRLHLHIEDAWTYVERKLAEQVTYDLIICDLTVPADLEGARFHTIEWYERLGKLAGECGLLAVNGVSPWATARAFWSIFNSMVAANLNVLPLKVQIPSFARLGYGPDWSFYLASRAAIAPQEFSHPLPLATPRSVLLDGEYLHRLFRFQFPEDVLGLQSSAHPAALGSDILLHYFRNGEEHMSANLFVWDALNDERCDFSSPAPDCGDSILPPEIKDKLQELLGRSDIGNVSAQPVALNGSGFDTTDLDSKNAAGVRADGPISAEELFRGVTSLMPSLHRYQTKQAIAEFLSRPLQFLQSIDLPALVAALLRRAAELPERLVQELRHLKERLVDFCGDYEALMQTGHRVLTVVALVVIVGNLMHPEAVYGKGEHGGGGHGGGHDGGRGGDRGGDRGDRGDRGFGNRGFGNRGFGGNRFGRWDGWRGGWRHGYGWGTYGWARPYHGGWWGGGWGWPGYYGGGYINVNLNNQSTDEEGNQYQPRNFRYNSGAVVQNYNWGGSDANAQPSQGNPAQFQAQLAQGNAGSGSAAGGDVTSSGSGGNGGGDGAVIDAAGRYKLAPQTEILSDGRIAIQLTDASYMLLGSSTTQIVEQSTGSVVMTLATDPALLFQVGAELKRQSFSLQHAIQNQQFSNNSADSQDGYDDDSELNNMKAVMDHLSKAQNLLGDPPAPQQAVSAPLVPGAIEVFAGVWMLPQGNMLVFKRDDGSLVYMDGKKVYSDEGHTPLNLNYPTKFKGVVTAYLNKLIKDENATKASLSQDLKDGQDYLTSLQQELNDYQSGGADSGNQGLGGQGFAGQGGGQNAGMSGGDGQGGGDMVQFGSRMIPRKEAIRRTSIAIKRTQKKIDSINSQLSSLPAESLAVSKMLSALKV